MTPNTVTTNFSFFALGDKLYWKTKTKENEDIFEDYLRETINAMWK